ncbi:hypothetical protein LTR94_024213, partial [Friedmanniomyces endolithicus]
RFGLTVGGKSGLTTRSNPPKAKMNDAVDPVDIAIGARIRTRREELRITQAQLAAGAGVTFQQIQKYERGVNRVSAARLLRIAAVLKSTGAALLGELETAEGDELVLASPGVAELLSAFRSIDDASKRDALLVVARGLRN